MSLFDLVHARTLEEKGREILIEEFTLIKSLLNCGELSKASIQSRKFADLLDEYVLETDI